MKRVPLPPPEVIRTLPPDGGPEFNRLIFETSPYLLQHARNPVDWYPWGEEAKVRAKAEDKPIFLSIGYSSCHWCHVMERESFENPEIAAILNRYFVPVKVDREERPDIDELYMLVTQIMTGHGGWPNSVWLLPDGSPWYAGTYFPPDDRPGRIGFKRLLLTLADFWQKRREDVEEQARRFREFLQAHAAERLQPAAAPGLKTVLSDAYNDWGRSYDLRNGGFGSAPKFPPHAALDLMLYQETRDPDPRRRSWIVGTLDAMAIGGIRDHIGGGFHRYSVDEAWAVPHFEKMLYDNAQLLSAYARATALYRRDDHTLAERFADVAREIVEWLEREMTGPDGAFYTALDADSEGEEGRYYVWSFDDVVGILGDDASAFANRYGIRPEGNYCDEATGLPTRLNIPRLAAPLPLEERDLALSCRAILLEARSRRPPPGRDNKVLTAWNGLMIEALAVAAEALQEERFIRLASRAAHSLRKLSLVNGELMRIRCGDRVSVPAFLDDHAALALGYLKLFQLGGESHWLEEALWLGDRIVERFIDPLSGMPNSSGPLHEKLIARLPDIVDQSVPSSVALAVRCLAGLAPFGRPHFLALARRAVAAALPVAARYPTACAAFLRAALEVEEASAPSVRLQVLERGRDERGRLFVRGTVEFSLPPGLRLQPQADGNLFRLETRGPVEIKRQNGAEFVVAARDRAEYESQCAPTELVIRFGICDEWACRSDEIKAFPVRFEDSSK